MLISTLLYVSRNTRTYVFSLCNACSTGWALKLDVRRGMSVMEVTRSEKLDT